MSDWPAVGLILPRLRTCKWKCSAPESPGQGGTRRRGHQAAQPPNSPASLRGGCGGRSGGGVGGGEIASMARRRYVSRVVRCGRAFFRQARPRPRYESRLRQTAAALRSGRCFPQSPTTSRTGSCSSGRSRNRSSGGSRSSSSSSSRAAGGHHHNHHDHHHDDHHDHHHHNNHQRRQDVSPRI